MRITIVVSSRDEGDQLRAGLDDPTVRAFVRTIGILNALPSHNARMRVLRFIDESFAEQRGVAPVLDWRTTVVTDPKGALEITRL